MAEISRLQEIIATRLDRFVAVTTPNPDAIGNTSEKTCILQLPVYEIDLRFDDSGEVKFNCDLADLTGLIDKLKNYQNQLRRFGKSRDA